MSRALSVLRESLAAERGAPKGERRGRDDLAFLPAVLEVMETPPSPTARVLAWLLCLLFTSALAWSWFGRVDVIAVAEGRTIPSGRSKVVQAAELGVIRAIDVREGDRVAAGTVLIELDPTEADANTARAGEERLAALADAARFRALLADAPDVEAALAQFVPPDGAATEIIESGRLRLRSEYEEQRAKLATLTEERAKAEAERAQIAGSITRLDQTIPLIFEREEALRVLAEKGFGSRLKWLEIKQMLIDATQERSIQSFRLREAEAHLASLERRRGSAIAEFRRAATAQLDESERRAAALHQELIKTRQRRGLQTIAAPIDGRVQQLAVNTVGGVVQPAQRLMVLVPDDERLEVEAKVKNRDVGFVRVGQHAEVKIEAFNFTRYGLVPGEVVSLSGDGVADERTGEVYYLARVRLDRANMDIDGIKVALTAGLTATVEIKTDQRRVIEYLLSPIQRYAQEAIRER
jgi:hemolysin D